MQLSPWSIRGKENHDLRPPKNSDPPQGAAKTQIPQWNTQTPWMSQKLSPSCVSRKLRPLDVLKTWVLVFWVVLIVSTTQNLKLTKTASKRLMALRSKLTLRHTTQKKAESPTILNVFKRKNGTYLFVLIHSLIKIKFLTNSKRAWVACVRGCIYFKRNLRLILTSDSLIFYVMKEMKPSMTAS